MAKIHRHSWLKNSESEELDAMLRDLNTESEDFQIDLNVGSEPVKPSGAIPVDFSVSKDLVPIGRKSTDSTVSRELARMDDLAFLGASSLRQKRIVYEGMDDYSLMNSFREIRTRLLQKTENNNFVLIVASVSHNMGATFTTANLGVAFSYEGERTALLVDCDPLKSNLSGLFDLNETLGLSDYLNNTETDLSRIIYPTGISRIRLIPGGSVKNAGFRYLTSERMKEFLSVLKKRYKDRFIFINAPPLEDSADAAILSEFADYILIVVPYGKVSNNRLSNAIKSLPPEKIVGVVMNNCTRYV